MTEDRHLDTKIKMAIANVHIGLLEKGTTRRQTSEVFLDFDEAAMHVGERGGNMNIMTTYEYVKHIVEANDDYVVRGYTSNVDCIEELKGDYNRHNADEDKKNMSIKHI